MTYAVVAPTKSTIFTKLRTFIQSIINCEVIQGFGNLTAMPVGGFIVITPLFMDRLSTNYNTFHDGSYDLPAPTPGIQQSQQAVQYTIQIDCYGISSNEWANAITTLWRDDFGCQSLLPDCQPLYADNPKQMALIDGEQNYTQRWAITAVMQYNPVTTVPMEFFDSTIFDMIDVDSDTTYDLQ